MLGDEVDGACNLNEDGNSCQGCERSAAEKPFKLRFASKSTAQTRPSSDIVQQGLTSGAFSPMAECCSELAAIKDSLKGAYSAASEIAAAVSHFKANVSPELFESARAISEAWTANISGLANVASRFDFSGLRAAVLPLQKRFHVLGVLKESNWPLHLVGSDELTAELEEADRESPTLLLDIADIAERYLDDSWLESVSKRWETHEELGEGKGALLTRTLEFHRAGEFDACVATLMCLFEGLTVEYMGPSIRLESEEDMELFDFEAAGYGLTPLSERKRAQLFGQKDLVLAMSLKADTGWYVWREIVGYIIGVVLTNKDNEALAAHNPLRNKICHGIQTNYGTKEHSLKAILATDSLIRLGSAALLGMRMREADGLADEPSR